VPSQRKCLDTPARAERALRYCLLRSLPVKNAHQRMSTHVDSRTENMNISTLNQRVEDLEGSVNFWNDLYIWLLAFTTLLAAVLFVTQYVAGKRGRQLATAQKELLEAKDKQLSLDLKSKDVGIEEAKKDAATASSRAEDLKKQNLETEKKLEQERLSRIELEERVAFRRIVPKERTELASRLKSFAGQTVGLWFNVGDHEGAIFASDIASALEVAKWNVYAPASISRLIPSGSRSPTVVETGVIVASTGHGESIKAADAIVRKLLELGFDARKSSTIDKRLNPFVLVNVEARPIGSQGEAKLRKQKK